jgi:uncharacterized protein YjaZ
VGEMQIINGLEHFKQAVSKINRQQDKVQFWMEYYNEYNMIFNTIINRLYMTDLENVKSMVKDTDFNQLAQQAEESLLVNSIRDIKAIVDKCISFFNFQQDFDVYLLVGLGHIDGTALKAKKPFIYLGLERLVNTDVEALIEHEFNHLVRFNTLREYEDYRMSVGQLVVAEGLATLTPLVINNMEFSETNIRKALFVSEMELLSFKNNIDKIVGEINADFDKEITPSLMAKYFMKNADYELGKSGYFYGVQIIKLLIDKGWNLRDLTTLNSQSIMGEYNSL